MLIWRRDWQWRHATPLDKLRLHKEQANEAPRIYRLVGGATIACPFGVQAQQQRRIARVGILKLLRRRYSRVAEFTESLLSSATSKAETSSLFTAGLTASSIECLPWPRNWPQARSM